MNQKKILVAEDDNLIAQAYTDGLSNAGYTVWRAKNGLEAIKQIKEKKPNLVLLDLRMPQKDGFEVLKELNKEGLVKDTNIIVASNLDHDKDIERCLKLGAKDYIIKSNYAIEDIVKVIKKFLN